MSRMQDLPPDEPTPPAMAVLFAVSLAIIASGITAGVVTQWKAFAVFFNGGRW